MPANNKPAARKGKGTPEPKVNAKAFARYGKRRTLIPLRHYLETDSKGKSTGKLPRTGWTTKNYVSASVIHNAVMDNTNVGWRLGPEDLVLDIDPRNGGLDSFARLCFDVSLDQSRYVRVDSGRGDGGFHLYMLKPADMATCETPAEYPGIEFKAVGRQVVCAGSLHHATGKHYAFVAEGHPQIEGEARQAPKALLKLIQYKPSAGSEDGDGVMTAEGAERLLDKLNPENVVPDNDAFETFAPAAKKACADADAEAYVLDWLARDKSQDSPVARWNSYRNDKAGGIGVGTFIYILKRHGVGQEAIDSVFGERDKVEAADDFPDDDDGGPKGAAEDFDDMRDEERGADFDAWTPPEDDGVAPEEPPRAVLKDWQFIVESGQFIHSDGVQRWSDKQFSFKFGYLARTGDVIKHIKQGKIKIQQYDRQVYIPNAPPVVHHDGAPAFNIWRPSAMTPQGGDHQWFLDHVAYMFPDAQSQSHVLDFMAQLIQFPEVKIHFALLIQSRQGVGKGALAMILRKMIGRRNTVEPSNDEVIKTYTGWQEGAQLAIINELMAGGSASVLNRLKSPITEDTLRIEKKFGNTFSIPNHMNLFAMTNHKDALPIPADDRRWLILFSSASKQPAEYYDALFDNIADDSKVAAVMQYLLERFITFNPKAPAPMTDAKRDMAERSQSDATILLKDMLAEGRTPFHFDLVRAADIVAKIKETPGEKNANKTAATFLDDINAAKLAKDKNAVPSYQLYAVRNHTKWQRMGRADTLAAFIEARPDLAPDEPDDE
ncbi:bifunctional DNA primase/polymerase [Bradyrhizobium sp. 200]|uniref:DUF5906 domain-containing protein n=1 Tax=Bradyrhizobium sp. 200 TaxID=2782665 RepID=UPI001FFE9B1F|nr:DUF5906 domain-containing protein [Bradyrhizobium sp. 200]UPJ49895.1 bifunctional DNA primase/polymerase [Bradyrhizobium sp. 200]